MASILAARNGLERKLAALQDDVLRLGGLVEDAIERSVEALKERDEHLARQVIEDDARINALRYKIEEAALVVLATQQPAARDLRFVVAVMHIAVELERMADHASGIASVALRLLDQAPLRPLIDLPRMADTARTMIHSGLDAFVRRDPALAQGVAAQDEVVDDLYQQVLRELLTYMLEDPKNIGRATYLLWAAHNLERIGDRATNLCERTIFVATGQLQELHP